MSNDTTHTPFTIGRLAVLLDATVEGEPTRTVTGIYQDSRKVGRGDIFVARKGERADGLRFIPQAVRQGASGILVQRNHRPTTTTVPLLIVDDIRVAIGKAAAALYGDPTSELKVVGLTGTNGKTTTSHLLAAAIDAAGGRTGLLGTLGTFFEDQHFDTGHTTPEADEIMRQCRQMVDHGATHLAMEVSSHALALHRADSVRFEVAAFTNLTQDHLDFHHDLRAYGDAKRRLFFDLAPAKSVVMIDDEFGARLHADLKGHNVTSVSSSTNSNADFHPIGSVHLGADGIECDVQTPRGKVRLRSSQVGEHNLANLLLTLGIIHALELPLEPALEGLAQAKSVPGRMERCSSTSDDISVLVDYAHTPDALQRALQTLRPMTKGKLWCVFGCGGDRDKEKRPLMGRVVATLADEAIVTNDNPRSEPPERIAEQVLEGMKHGQANVRKLLDRRAAIELAVENAKEGDVVLVAGKGHEPYQLIGDQVLSFDDREQASRALAKRAKSKE